MQLGTHAHTHTHTSVQAHDLAVALIESAWHTNTHSIQAYDYAVFCSSPTERAFEAGTELKDGDRDNSIFVSAFKHHLQHGSLKERLDTLLTDAAAGGYAQEIVLNPGLCSFNLKPLNSNWPYYW